MGTRQRRAPVPETTIVNEFNKKTAQN